MMPLIVQSPLSALYVYIITPSPWPCVHSIVIILTPLAIRNRAAANSALMIHIHSTTCAG